ncbi:transcriptional regulator [Bacillus cereus]|nr:transcriptional regulator [Bacillus cereus]
MRRRKMTESEMKFRDTTIRNFFDKEDRLKAIPSQKKKKLVLLEHLVSKLNAENQYTEKEMNTFIKQYHKDFCTIRREFIVHGFMDREDNMYQINGREVWTKWEEL